MNTVIVLPVGTVYYNEARKLKAISSKLLDMARAGVTNFRGRPAGQGLHGPGQGQGQGLGPAHGVGTGGAGTVRQAAAAAAAAIGEERREASGQGQAR